MKTEMIKRSLFFFSLFFLMSGSFSFAQTMNKEKKECIQVFKSSKEYELLKSKLQFADSEVEYEDISTDNNNCTIRMHLKKQPDISYEYLVDTDSKTVKNTGVEDLR